MNHLTYQQTNNKSYKQYYDRFKKMVKEDLSGDGWFLLVKDFPFRDGDKLMLTMGEDIGKWKDKNLVSLYGKTKYIIGRCRKKGPVISLLDFQEGDYIKVATESGLRTELKEYFKGTGVSVRIFKSTKVKDPEPEEETLSTGDQPDPQTSPSVEDPQKSELNNIREMVSRSEKQDAISLLIRRVLKEAEEAGITDSPTFNIHKVKLQRFVQGGKADEALNEIGLIQDMITQAKPDESSQDPSERVAKLQNDFRKNLQKITQLLEEDKDDEIQTVLNQSKTILAEVAKTLQE